MGSVGQSGCAWIKVGKRFSYCTYFCMKKSEKGVCVCVYMYKRCYPSFGTTTGGGETELLWLIAAL